MVAWAPLNTPFPRRRQTAAVLFLAVLIPMCFTLFFFLCTIPVFWPLVAIYVTWLYLDDAPENGGRRIQWVRHLRLWKWARDYFPLQLIREGELDPQRTYIAGFHPHGVISVSALLSIGTEACDVENILPGINMRLLTLTSNFNIPLYRDIILAMNVAGVSKRSIENILRKGPGNAAMIVVGGASESLYARPKTNNLVLQRRAGFVKLAIKNGASLVPVFSFGENDMYDQLPNEKGSIVYSIQKQMQKLLGFTMPLFHGRGVFNYDMGLLPWRVPLTVVIGKPIHVVQDDTPSEEYVEKIHREYMESLQALYDKYKDIYAKDRISELQFVE
ncbi:diacylglycerol acyltransferase [Ramicandelaber brevisporus]|nr:diacylglycerol acyltransferase [Ramicandelaber brevisporus]